MSVDQLELLSAGGYGQYFQKDRIRLHQQVLLAFGVQELVY